MTYLHPLDGVVHDYIGGLYIQKLAEPFLLFFWCLGLFYIGDQFQIASYRNIDGGRLRRGRWLNHLSSIAYFLGMGGLIVGMWWWGLSLIEIRRLGI